MINRLTQAVILAGGRGERLRPLTDSMPKPMAPINGIPFLDYLIHSIIQAGIENILILLGYKADMIASDLLLSQEQDFPVGTEIDVMFGPLKGLRGRVKQKNS